MVLVIEDLSTEIEGTQILRNVDLTVEEGSVTALVGPNGAGKTTTFRTVMGLASPTSGSVVYQGTDLDGVPTHERKRMGIGFGSEDRGLIPSLTTRENVEMSLWGQATEPSTEEKEAKVQEMLEYFPEMEAFLDRDAGKLSGGQQQMTTIARALIAEPDLLLLDEPFEGLAPSIVSSLKSSLSENLEDDVTIFVSESEINHVADFADRIHVIDRGEILATNLTHEELLDDDELMEILGG